MLNIPSGTALLLLSAMAGAVHVLAPDHWIPASLLGWRRGWTNRRLALFAASGLLAHVALGLLIYFAFRDFLEAFAAARLFAFTLAFVCLVGLVRALRFSKVEDIFRSRAQSGWQVWTILSLLGPCESIVPILIKSSQMGVGYAAATGAFLVGTVSTGVVLMISGRFLWDRPELFSIWGGVLRRRVGPIPIAGIVAVGLLYLVRLS